MVALWNIVNPGSTGAAKTVKLEFKGVKPAARVAVSRVDEQHGNTLGLYEKMGKPALSDGRPDSRLAGKLPTARSGV